MVEGHSTDFAVRGRGLGAHVHGRIWSPANATGPLPLLIAHDGPEYDKLAFLTRYAGAMIAAGTLPPHRVALLSPGPRDEWYSASALYSRALYVDVVPGLREAVPVEGLPVGMGASLGALAMLVTQRRAPGTFGALFLQSGSFFMPRFDSQESGFPRYGRIVRVVRRILRSRAHPDPVPVQLTCGTAEENVFDNRVMARALAEQGYDARLDEVVCWKERCGRKRSCADCSKYRIAASPPFGLAHSDGSAPRVSVYTAGPGGKTSQASAQGFETRRSSSDLRVFRRRAQAV